MEAYNKRAYCLVFFTWQNDDEDTKFCVLRAIRTFLASTDVQKNPRYRVRLLVTWIV